MPSASMIVLSFNLLLLVAVVLGFLGGIIKGFYKSLFYLLFSIVFFVVGIIVIPYISEMLLTSNLKFIEGVIPSEANIEMTSIKETLPQILAYYAPDQAALFVPGSETMALVFGLMKLVLNFVLFIVLILLNATLLKLIPLIVWLFIRPKRNPLTGDKPKKHRLLGGLVGAVKGFAALLLVAIPLAGISSIAIAAEPVYEILFNEENNPTGSSSEIVTLAENEQDEIIKAGFDLMKTYQKSIIGTVFGVGNLDVNLFDRALKINVKSDDSNENLYLRRDVAKVLKISEILLKANDKSTNFDLSYLFKITEEDLINVQKEIKGLSILNVAKNVGFEIGYDYLTRENLLEGYEELISLSTLKTIDLNDEINTLIDVVIIINESENQEEIFENVFSLTKEEATAVFDKLSELQAIQIGLPLAVNFAFNMPETIQTMEENNINPDDLKRPTQEELMSDFKNIVNIYTLAKDMGFEHTSDFQNINEDFVIEIEDVHIQELFNVVFDFSFLYKNDELFANLVYDFIAKELEEEYLEIIGRETLVENFNAGEMASIALLGKLLFTESLFSGEEEIDFVVILREENVEKISAYISESNILSKGTEGLLSVFTKDTDFVEIIVPTGYSFKGTNGKTELKAILRSVRNIFEIGLTEENFDYASITDDQIEEISLNFSSSLIIRYNLSPIINQTVGQTEFDFITSDEDESFWTKDEIYYTIRALKIFASEEIDETNIHSIEDAKVLEISKSQTISNAVSKFLVHENEPGGMLNDELVIPEGLVYYSTETEPGEVYYFFVGAKEILGDFDLDNFDIEMEAVLNMDLEKVFDSKILEATIVENHLKCICQEDYLSKFIVESYENGDEFDWYKDENPNNPKGDSLQLIESLALLDDLGITYGSMNYATFINVLTNDSSKAQEINDAVIASAVLNASLPKMLNELINVEGELDLEIYPYYNKGNLQYWGEEGVNKELFYLLDALVVADEMEDFDYELLNNSNKEDFKAGANKIAKSETLIQMLPRIIENSNLTMAEDLKSDVDPNSLTEAEWNNEIDVLVDIIVLLNENETLDFDNPEPEHLAIITEIKTLMTGSLLYDETKITVV